MVDLPPELWNQVFYLACTDTGSTGRALSLVSKAFNEGSKRSQLRSVCITGLSQLSRFAQKVANLRPEYCATEYLFVSSDDRPQAGDHAASATEARKRDMLNRRRLLGMIHPSVEEATWTAQLLEILHIVSPTLRTLAVHGSNIPRRQTLLPINLPNLVELTVHTPITALLPDDQASVPLPQLRSLKLAIYPTQPILIIPCIRTLAPKLEYLLLSVVEKVADILGPLWEALSMPNQAGSLWNIKQVHIQPSDAPGALRRASTGRSLKDLHGLSRRDDRLTVHGMGCPWTVEEAQQDWLASMGDKTNF